MIRRRLKIEGKVQGVFFRATTREEANRLGVSGWVRNLPDGGVEVVVEGEPERVEALTAWCRKGPSHARVDGIEIEEEEPEGLGPDFQVRY